jgi:hypothetical protein
MHCRETVRSARALLGLTGVAQVKVADVALALADAKPPDQQRGCYSRLLRARLGEKKLLLASLPAIRYVFSPEALR